MVGKDCVAIASDLRLGNQALLVAANFEKVRSNEIEIEAGRGWAGDAGGRGGRNIFSFFGRGLGGESIWSRHKSKK